MSVNECNANTRNILGVYPSLTTVGFTIWKQIMLNILCFLVISISDGDEDQEVITISDGDEDSTSAVKREPLD